MRKYRVAALVILFGAGSILSGCLPFGVGDPEKSKIDDKLVGYWLAESAEGPNILAVVIPYDDHCYILQEVDYVKSDMGYDCKEPNLWRAWIVEIGGKRILATDGITQRARKAPPHAYGALQIVAVEEKQIQVASMNEDFTGIKDCKSVAGMNGLIEKEINNPDLFNPVTTFRRLDLKADKEMIEKVLGTLPEE